MTKLSLCITPQNIYILNLRQPLCFLLDIAKVLDGQAEHSHMHTDSREEALKVIAPIDVRRHDYVVDRKAFVVFLK